MIYLTKKEFEKRFGPGLSGIHVVEEGVHETYVPFKASTKTRMHEIGHRFQDWTESPRTIHDQAVRELEADKWVYDRLGRTPSPSEVLNDFIPLIDEFLEKNYSVSSIFNWVKREISRYGYELSKEDTSTLWWYIKKEAKGQKER